MAALHTRIITAMATPTEIIAAIDSQIVAILTGGTQSYSIAGRSISKLSLSELRELRKYYEGIQVSEANGLRPALARFRGPM